MRGIILAAGRGARLNGEGGDLPKCLVQVGGASLIERQIRSLRGVGIEDITVVVGFAADRVRRACGSGLRYVENARFDETNSLYSLWLCRHLLADGFVVMNADVLFHPRLLEDLVTARHDDALLISYSDPEAAPLGEEEMKVRVRGGRVVDISKRMDPREADGENVGVVKFSAGGAPLLVEVMEALIGAGRLREWAPGAFLEFARRRPLYAVGTRGYPWIEIDFPEDYRRATGEVLPQISLLEEEARGAGLGVAPDGARTGNRNDEIRPRREFAQVG